MTDTTLESETFRLYYWPSIPGRGEFVRLILEEAGVPYLDIARLPKEAGGGVERVMEMVRGEVKGMPPYAPPILKLGSLVVAQTALICDFLGQRVGLAGPDDRTRLAAAQVQLTIADICGEVHDTHHPIATSLYYEDQKDAAKQAAERFVEDRLPRWLAYLERVAEHHGGPWLLGETFTYVDLSVWHLLEGLRYAFPKAMAKQSAPRIVDIGERVKVRPNVDHYLKSDRRLPFNEDGIFRYYAELDSEG